MEWKEAVVFDDDEVWKSLQFVDSTFGEAYPIDCSVVRPEADSREQAKWACSLSAFNYVSELYNRVLIEPEDFPVGCGPLLMIEEVRNEQTAS